MSVPRGPAAATASTALLLFLAGLLLRLCFWRATPDAGQAWSVYYKGDAPLWQDLARAIATGAQPLPTEAKIPLRPPGMEWLTQLLWDGGDATGMRLLLVLLGACIGPLLFLLLRRTFAPRVAVLAGGLAIASTALLELGSSVNNEIPYVLLWLLSMFDWPAVAAGDRGLRCARWSVLHALACLFRAEHFLFVVALGVWLLLRRRFKTAATAALLLVLTLLPWHAVAWQKVADFNTTPRSDLPSAAALPWTADAMSALRALPAFQQAPTFGFIAATVQRRGGRRVTAADLHILEDAYGYLPEPLSPPFLALYGPLNFYLAHNPDAEPGFSKAGLDRAPPLRGGRDRYPPVWLANLPRDGTLSFGYPPHLLYVNHGYRLGLEWIAEYPSQALSLWGARLLQFWRGAALGLGGFGLPLGISGTRERVDIAVPDGVAVAVWQIAVVLLCVVGFAVGPRREALPWLLFLLTKAVAAVAFFGYARLGATCYPVVALLVALTVDRFVLRHGTERLWRRIGLSLLALLVLLEIVRWLLAPTATIDGRDVRTGDPFPPRSYEVREVEVVFGG